MRIDINRRKRILNYIDMFRSIYRIGPSSSVLANEFNVSRMRIKQYIDEMVANGWLRGRRNEKGRLLYNTLELTRRGRGFAQNGEDGK